MICPACGCNNEDNAKFCQKCGNSLNYYSRGNNYSQTNNYHQSRNNSNVIIIAVTVIIIALIVAGTFLLISDSLPFIDNNNQNNNQTSQITYNNQLKVNTATFYLDGNPNTGIKTTINVGKEHSGETMGVMTTFSRDGRNMNNPSEYGQCVVDNEGNIVFTDYTPIPKYPDYCLIEITYNNNPYKWECDMGKYKGSQTSVPRLVS